MYRAGVGCGRSVRRLSAIAQVANVEVDFSHDVLFHPLADCPIVGTHEKSVLYQATKLRPLTACNANDLMGEKKIYVGGVFHVRGYSDIFHFGCQSFTVAVWVGSFAPSSTGDEKREGELLPLAGS